MSSNKWHSEKTQVNWVCKALLDGRTISHKTEIREVRGWRLGAIVFRLKKEFGWPICTKYRGPENIAYYSLSPNNDRAKLRFPRYASNLSEVE